MLLLLTLMVGGCQADIDAPGLEYPEATMQANISIADLKTAFADVVTVGKIGTKADGSHYIIKGRVVSSDATGNIYQSLVIQDNTAAMDFSIGRASLYNIYPVGQEVVVDVTGLYIGMYGGLQRIGDYYESGGLAQPGRMLYAKFAEQSQLNGLPDLSMKYVGMNAEWPESSPYTIVADMENLPSAGEELRNMMSQLVEFHNVHFEDGGELPYAPYQETVNRTLVDQNGNKISVRNSGYSNFYNDVMPEGEGTVRGILSYYGNTSDSPWQLLLRSLDDVIFTSKGKREDPYTVQEVLAAGNNGMNAWAEGYILGTVKPGVAEVTSLDDITFGNDGDIVRSNLVLGPTADCRDLQSCIVLELPQGSRLREYANLDDNPDNLGRRILVNATFLPYLGMHGLVDSPGTFADFDIEGQTIDIPDGLGTLDMPYTCNYVINHTDEPSAAWVGGYVVGYVSGRSYDTGVHFEAPGPDADYANANLVLGPTAGCNDPALCIVVRLTSTEHRDALGLKNNPAIFGKYIRVEGKFGTYLNRAAVATLTGYKL